MKISLSDDELIDWAIGRKIEPTPELFARLGDIAAQYQATVQELTEEFHCIEDALK